MSPSRAFWAGENLTRHAGPPGGELRGQSEGSCTRLAQPIAHSSPRTPPTGPSDLLPSTPGTAWHYPTHGWKQHSTRNGMNSGQARRHSRSRRGTGGPIRRRGLSGRSRRPRRWARCRSISSEFAWPTCWTCGPAAVSATWPRAARATGQVPPAGSPVVEAPATVGALAPSHGDSSTPERPTPVARHSRVTAPSGRR